ncbi:class GN sortase [Glaciecola sp. 1036]|uniref:class GN sortase n=1 Tax=Alteromonadaceae TaxID=72275 RepID=UPI003D089912
MTVKAAKGFLVGSTAVLLLGIGFIACANYIQAKAWLAQYLIEQAWQQSVETNSQVKPWPWADTFVVGELQLPQQNLMILEGESLRNLAFGPTRMSSSAKFEQFGNTVIYGHRDTHFASLEEVKLGDRIQVKHKNGVRNYVINSIEVVNAFDSYVTAPSQDTMLTLITCYPFGGIEVNPDQRFVVKALAI